MHRWIVFRELAQPRNILEYGQICLIMSKAAFTLIYILIVNILSANKIIYKWPNLYIKTQIDK